MEHLAPLKVQDEELEMEFTVTVPFSVEACKNKEREEIQKKIQDIDGQIADCKAYIDDLDSKIDNLTNHADKLDYAVAIASGILCAAIDAIFVGQMDIKSATKIVDKKVADKVKKQVLKEKIDDALKKAKAKAKAKGKELTKEQIQSIKDGVTKKFLSDPNNLADKGGDPVLERAITYLENHSHVPQDNLFHGTGSSLANHHLDDLAHHPTIVGLIASIIVQYFRVAIFVNKEGKYSFKLVGSDVKETLKNWMPILITGLLNWLVFIAEKVSTDEDGQSQIPKPIFKLAHLLASAPAIISVFKAADRWCKHLYSDIAGSHRSARKGNRGAGIPGLFVSFLKELSCIPPLNLTGLPKICDELYKVCDLRTELAVAVELGKQVIPVIINELLVRSFYFVRRLIAEHKEHNGWENIDWKKVVPVGNRTVERMMTIASGTFMACDMAIAAIKSGGNLATFALNVNFVGIGRFVLAVVVDVKMGNKKSRLENERILLYGQLLNLSNAKLFYVESDMWLQIKETGQIEAEMWKTCRETEEAIAKTYEIMTYSVNYFRESWEIMSDSLASVSCLADDVENNNPGLMDELFPKKTGLKILEDQNHGE